MIDCSKIPLQDKGCHLIVGFVVALAIGIFALISGFDYPQGYGVLSGAVLGFVKEWTDYNRYGKFDFFDLFFTLIGAFFGGLVVALIA